MKAGDLVIVARPAVNLLPLKDKIGRIIGTPTYCGDSVIVDVEGVNITFFVSELQVKVDEAEGKETVQAH